MSATDRRESYDFDNLDPELPPVLFEQLKEMSSQCPVAWSPHHGGFWILNRYADVIEAARDDENLTVTGGILIPETGSKVPVIPAELDPPRHTQFRRIIQPHFTDRALKKWIPQIRSIVVEAFAKVLPTGRAELIHDVAAAVPVATISLILGTYDNNPEDLHSLTKDFLDGPNDPESKQKAALRLESHLKNAIDARRGQPVEDVLGELVNTELADGEYPTDAELLGMTQLLHVAGHDTTMNGIGTIVRRIIIEPGLREALLADRSILKGVINESLRLDPPVWNMARTVASDVEVGGSSLCPGEKVMLAYGAANRDPDVFDEPDSFIHDRPSNRHLAFGSGRHRCVGERLAQLELNLVLEYILDAIPDIELDGEIVWGPARNNHGIDHMPVRFTPPAGQ